MSYCETKPEKVSNILNGRSCENQNVEYKREKKDKGLYERTEECKVLLTEDNKMLLND